MKAYLKATVITAVIVVVLYGCLSLIVLAWTANTVLALRKEVPALQTMAQQQDWGRLANRLPVIADDIRRANSSARAAGWLRFVPIVREPFTTYSEAIDAAASITTIASISLAQAISGDGKTLDVQQLFTSGLQSYEELLTALNRLQSASERVEEIAPGLIPPSIRQDWQTLLGVNTQFQAVFTWLQPYLNDVPTLLGAQQPFELLVILQNPHELRATGGFIGTYGRITIDRGVITQFYTDDIYNLDVALLNKKKLIPPEPMQRYLGISEWYIRDANWSPDFPSSMTQLLSMYGVATDGEEIDMVVALTPALVESFLHYTGPITVDGITFTSENVIDAIQYRVEQEFWRIGLRDDERKKIINDLAQSLKERFFALDRVGVEAVIAMVQTGLKQRDIQLFSTRIALQRPIQQAGWSGEVQSSAHDYLFVVDSNLGALKTDRLVDRTYAYTVTEQANGTWLASLKLTYTNRAQTFDYRTTRYRTYTRVYMPMGSTLRSAQGYMANDKQPATAQPLQYAELGKQVIAGFVSIEPGQTRTVTLTYELAPWLVERIKERQQYDLTWQKQAGAKINSSFALMSAKPLRSFAPSTLSYKLESPQRVSIERPLEADAVYTVGLMY